MKNIKNKIISGLAISCLILAFSIFGEAQTNDEKIAEANKLYSEAVSHFYEKKVESYVLAMSKFASARKLYTETGNSNRARLSFNGLANSALELNGLAASLINVPITDFDQSVRHQKQVISKLKEAIVILDNSELPYYSALLYITIGWMDIFIGDLSEALSVLDAAQKIYSQGNSYSGQATAIKSKGWVYDAFGDYEKAVECYLRAILLYKKGNDENGVAGASTNLGHTYILLGRTEEAISFLIKALKYREQTQSWYDVALVSGSLGRAYLQQKNYEKALYFLKKSYTGLMQIDYNSGYIADVLNNVGELFAEQKKTLEAVKYFNLGLDYAKKSTDLNYSAKIYDNLMRVNFSTSPYLAVVYGKQAVKYFQRYRVGLKSLTTEQKKNYLKKIERTYRYLADILISQNRFSEAQTILDLLKDEEYGQLTRGGENTDKVPYRQAEDEAVKIIDNLATLGRRRVELEKLQTEKGSLSAAEQRELDEIYKGIERANAELQKALEALKTAEPTAKEKLAEIESQQNLTATLEDLSRETGAGAVALYTVVGTEEIKNTGGKADTKAKFGWVVLVTPKESKAYPIDVAELEETVFAFRGGLSSTVYNPEPLAKKLYDKIFRQKSPRFNSTLEQDLQKLFGGNDKIPTIMWSLDGVLRYVPMAALHDGKSYLVEKYRHLVFTKQSLAGLSVSDKKWSVLGLGVSEKRENFDAIPGVEKELKDIVCLNGETNCILNGTRRLNKEFTKEDTLRLWQRGEFPVIHIASHFSFNPTDQTASFLLIGDGRLNFADIQNKRGLFNAVDLLTLSACDTAMSANGKESESFAWLAQSLGAKTVLASLWKVSDAGTPELMIRFYKIRSENPQMPKAEAFRQAQISLLNAETKSQTSGKPRSGIFTVNGKKYELPLWEKDDKKPFAHPHFWSSFVLIGNWR